MAKKKSRKSASLKEQAVLRLLKGEDMELVSVDMLCQLLAVARSSYYDYLRQKNQKAQGHKRKKPGPKVRLDDKALLQAILDVMTASPFVTEGIKKVHARLRRKGIKASRNRINLIMREQACQESQSAVA